MSMFATTAETNYDGLSIPNLNPGKYENCNLVKVEFGKTTKGDGTSGKQIITFTFSTPEGMLHQHTEYESLPGEKDSEKKTANMLKRIGHIMSKFVPKERLTQQSATFADYGNWVVSTLTSVGYKDQKVDLLLTGNVYQGKATSNFTGYPPFIAKHGDTLQFDNNGLKANKEWQAFEDKKTARPDQDGGNPANGGVNTQASPPADF